MCATTNSGNILWDTMPTIATTKLTTETLPGGGIQEFLTITASEEHNNTIVTCVIVTGTIAATHSALLLVQGESFTSCICFSVDKL